MNFFYLLNAVILIGYSVAILWVVFSVTPWQKIKEEILVYLILTLLVVGYLISSTIKYILRKWKEMVRTTNDDHFWFI